MFSYNLYKYQLDVPGTEVLVDDNNLDMGKDIIYVPEPSSDPNDPLNWTKTWKSTHIVICFLYALVNAAGLGWTGTLYAVFTKEFGVSYNQLNTASGLLFLFLAIGCWVSNLSSSLFGKRTTYLTSSFLVAIASVVFATSRAYGGMMGYCIINGFAIAPMDTLVESSIGDIFFLHEHGRYMAIYTLCLSFGSNIGSILAGYFLPWAWCNYALIIGSGSVFIAQLIFLEESQFSRLTVSINFNNIEEFHDKTNVHVLVEEALENVPIRKSFVSRISLQPPNKRISLWIIYEVGISPFIVLRYPAVMWAAIAYGIQICWLSLIGLTVSEFYSGEPYYFSTTSIGNLSYAGIIGGVIGSIYISTSDKYHIWRTKKNNGISEPEFRLDLVWIPIIVNCLGICLYGYGPAYKMKWIVGAVGIAMINFSILCLIGVLLTYVMECYPKQVTKTMVAILFVRNMMGTVFNWVFQYWLDAMGIKNLTAVLTVICFVVNGLVIIFVLWGKNIRNYTSKWYSID